MGLRALRFVAGPDGVEPARSELTDEVILSFVSARLQSNPCAYVVLNRDLPSLSRFKDLVVDRGRKHEAKPLARLLLGHARIPFINGSYESSGQLVRSIRALLQNAFNRDEHNIYIIGTTERILDDLWEKAAAATPSRSRKPYGSQGFRNVGLHPPGAPSSRSLLQLLPQVQIPEDLIRTFLGQSEEVQLVRQLTMRAASSDDPVLILGDTGTGKEVIARAIHKHSARASEKFVPVNCGAIPGELLESELFGHKRYTFTDAKFDKKGLWEITGNGTLFLDEIGDLVPLHQVKILRALEESKIRPIGESKEVKVNARVIAATNRDLFAMVKAGQFREDLYYRLRAFLIRTPVLRDHPDDIPVLASFFWRKITRDDRAKLPDDVLAELQSYGWPGNARELKAVLMSLHSLFGKEGLDASRLKAVFQIQGQVSMESPREITQREITTHRVDCIGHLRKADELLRACAVSAKALVERGQTDAETAAAVRASLRTRLGELELLSLNPLLFHSTLTFEIVEELKERLSFFCGLLEGDAKVAQGYWNNEVRRELKLGLTAIFQETARLEANI